MNCVTARASKRLTAVLISKELMHVALEHYGGHICLVDPAELIEITAL